MVKEKKALFGLVLLVGCSHGDESGSYMNTVWSACVSSSEVSLESEEESPFGFSVRQMLDVVPDAAQIDVIWDEDDLGLASETTTTIWFENIHIEPDGGRYVEQEPGVDEPFDCPSYVEVDGSLIVRMDGVLEPQTIHTSFRAFESWDQVSFEPLLPYLDEDVELAGAYRATVEAELAKESACGDAQYDGAYLTTSATPGLPVSLGVTSLLCLDDPEGALFRSGGIVAGQIAAVVGIEE